MCHGQIVPKIISARLLFMGYLKSCVYDIQPHTTDNMKHVCEKLTLIPEEIMHNIMTDFT